MNNKPDTLTLEEFSCILFSNGGDLFAGVGLDGMFRFVNPAWVRILGFSEKELRSKPITAFIHEQDRASSADVLQRIALGEDVDFFENRLVTKSGEIVYISWNGVFNEKHQLICGIGRNTTKIRAREQIEKEFVAVASHELRTPLTAIKSTLDLIAHGIAGDIPTHALALIKMSNDSADHLLRMINNILDMDKIESGRMEAVSEPVILYDAIKTAVDANTHYGASVGVIFVIKETLPEIVVAIDKDRIIQVMDNLLSNAAKYGSGADIVEIRMLKESSRIVRVSVTDHGPGIDKSLQPLLFQKFAQGKLPKEAQGTRVVHGTGLGLSICKSLIELYGGQIGYFSHKGKGTTFYFDLPIVPSNRQELALEPLNKEESKLDISSSKVNK